MRSFYCFLIFSIPALTGAAQTSPLSVEKIMADPKWIGTSPSNVFWGTDARTVYFSWNPDRNQSDSLYFISLENVSPEKATPAQKLSVVSDGDVVYDKAHKNYVYSADGDIYFYQQKNKALKRITNTNDFEFNPVFSFGESKIVYTRSQNMYAWDIRTGETIQLTNIRNEVEAPTARGSSTERSRSSGNSQDEWLKNDQLSYFEVLRMRKEKNDAADLYKKNNKEKQHRLIALGDKSLQGLTISPDGRFISYRLAKPLSGKNTIVPNYVTESGYTTDINGRFKVGAQQSTSDLYVYDRQRDSIFSILPDSIFGIKDIPAYVKDYPKQWEEMNKWPALRNVTFLGPKWSPNGAVALFDVRSADHKDRWLMTWDTASHKLALINRQHDDAWIGGPAANLDYLGWIDNNNIWFESEASGYSHIYISNIIQKTTTPFTSGNYEILSAALSSDKKYFYVTSNEVEPGQQQFYRLRISDGTKQRITQQEGASQVSLSPDEKYIAYLYSYTNKPWELFVQENKPGAKAIQVTHKARSETFDQYPWRDPELITFAASDGAPVYARLYKPTHPHPDKPAILFVHGAGYLQNAHKWWSSYFREYMFNNLLADAGYYVMDIDYRGSAGYGRDWRTGIYRNMGGKDLTDNIDAAKFLEKNYGVNPAHIGLYGGSYGGFITLMAMFKTPGTFAAGAALRPVTDWANYNQSYTSEILNEPFNDSIAYHRSSPIYFANGLRGNLLICHGMVDVNVHFQDAVKLTQRLIELGKDNWELAPYPVEDHGFVEPSSWTDEYKRIFRLFETTLKK